MHPRTAFLLAAVLALGAPARGAAAQQPTVVILVRHAEKASQPAADPPLTADGEARALALRAALTDTHLDGIVTTQFVRTRATAGPVALAQHLEPTIVAAGGGVPAHARAVADTIRTRFAGRTVLVVGHSNTIPAIVAALGGPSGPDLCDAQYSAIFTVIVRAEGGVSTIESRYGAPDAPFEADCPRAMRQRS